MTIAIFSVVHFSQRFIHNLLTVYLPDIDVKIIREWLNFILTAATPDNNKATSTLTCILRHYRIQSIHSFLEAEIFHKNCQH